MAKLGFSCAKDKKYIGMLPCTVNAGNEKGHVRMPKGTTIDLDVVDFNFAYVESKIQDGTFTWIGNAFSQVTETPDSGTEQAPTGKLASVQKGLPVTTTLIKSNYEFHQQIYADSANDAYDVLVIYESNVIMASYTGRGNIIKGFSVGMYDVGGWQPTNGTVLGQTKIMYQIDDAFEFNTSGVYLTDLDFNANTGVKNIVGVKLTGRADVSQNKIYVKAVWSSNFQYPLSIFAKANFRILLGDVAEAIAGATVPYVDEEYVIEPTTAVALSQNWKVELWDGTESLPATKVAGQFYAGITDPITPVA